MVSSAESAHSRFGEKDAGLSVEREFYAKCIG